MIEPAGHKKFRTLVLVIVVFNVLACDRVNDREDQRPREPSGTFFLIPELLTDSGQTLLLTVDRDNPELLAFATERDAINLYLEWNIVPLGDGFYQISNSGRPRDESLALSIVDDGVYDQVAMSVISDFSGQKWRFTHLENGNCRLTTKLLGLDMALTVVNDTESQRLTIASVSNDPGQHWRLEFFATYGIFNDPLLIMCDGR